MNLHIEASSGVTLTPKGEAYAERHLSTRQAIEAEIDRLIDLLDSLDGDADLEPSLGAPETQMICMWGAKDFCAPVTGQEAWADGYGSMDEENAQAEDAGGGDILDEPHDCPESTDCEADEPCRKYPSGSYLFGGGSRI